MAQAPDGGGLTFEQQMQYDKAKSQHKAGLVVSVTLCIAILCLFVPLGVWLTRMAMGM